MQKMLTTVQFEVNTTIRFKPNEGPANGSEATGDDDGQGDLAGAGEGDEGQPPRAPMPKPEVKANVRVKRYGERRRRTRE
jgi:hypothetical protein